MLRVACIAHAAAAERAVPHAMVQPKRVRQKWSKGRCYEAHVEVLAPRTASANSSRRSEQTPDGSAYAHAGTDRRANHRLAAQKQLCERPARCTLRTCQPAAPPVFRASKTSAGPPFRFALPGSSPLSPPRQGKENRVPMEACGTMSLGSRPQVLLHSFRPFVSNPLLLPRPTVAATGSAADARCPPSFSPQARDRCRLPSWLADLRARLFGRTWNAPPHP